MDNRLKDELTVIIALSWEFCYCYLKIYNG